MTPGSFVSFNLGSLAEITEQGRNGGAISGDGVGRRRGESGGKWRGARVLPSGGLGSSGGGPQRRLHGRKGRPCWEGSLGLGRSVQGVGLGREWPDKGAPRRAELGSHGNGGWGALGARRGLGVIL